MDVIGITKDEQYEIFRLVASILWMGNIEFREAGSDKAEVADMAGKFD
jgi:myosin I